MLIICYNFSCLKCGSQMVRTVLNGIEAPVYARVLEQVDRHV